MLTRSIAPGPWEWLIAAMVGLAGCGAIWRNGRRLRLLNVEAPSQDVHQQKTEPSEGMHRGHRRHTLVLDLDGTLIFAGVTRPSRWRLWLGTVHCVAKTVVLNRNFVQLFVRTRPHLATFLEEVQELFELVIFTSGEKSYAHPLIEALPIKVIKERYYRAACLKTSIGFLKDLKTVGREPGKAVLLDDSETVTSNNNGSSILIKSWQDDPFDRELLNLLPLLRRISQVDDIRTVLG